MTPRTPGSTRPATARSDSDSSAATSTASRMDVAVPARRIPFSANDFRYGQIVTVSVLRCDLHEGKMRGFRIAAAICVAPALLSISLAVVSAHRYGAQHAHRQAEV